MSQNCCCISPHCSYDFMTCLYYIFTLFAVPVNRFVTFWSEVLNKFFFFFLIMRVCRFIGSCMQPHTDNLHTHTDRKQRQRPVLHSKLHNYFFNVQLVVTRKQLQHTILSLRRALIFEALTHTSTLHQQMTQTHSYSSSSLSLLLLAFVSKLWFVCAPSAAESMWRIFRRILGQNSLKSMLICILHNANVCKRTSRYFGYFAVNFRGIGAYLILPVEYFLT